ncbi:MAG: alpha-L-fucosidase [Oscillospiraceae bacterium]|nr:alpha-L-fucosidase [Oscillospiraceae bacterium]
MTKEQYLRQIQSVIDAGPYRADWGSLSCHPVPDWYRRSKFGIFIHWGIYSVPAFGNEWYSRNMYDPAHREFAHHRRTWGDQKTFGYKDFIPLFRGKRFDPDAWMDLFQKAGARYVVPVAEHHDGFAMYDTDLNPWNAVNMGPKTDAVGRLKAACQDRGLQFCASLHRAEHYFFMNMGRTFDSDVNDPRYEDFYGPAVYRPEFGSEKLGQTTENPHGLGPTEDWLEDWLVRTCEFIDNYRPALLYFDWWIQNLAFKPWLQKIAAYYYNRAAQWGMEVTVNYKHQAFPPGVGVFDVERGALTDISPVPWQTCTAIGKQSWGYRADNEYKSSRQIICDLIDIVSKNGRLLLNVGPRADGTLTPEERQVLEDMGRWMEVNGEGIQDTVPWFRFGEGRINNDGGFFRDNEEKAYTGQDYRFTYKGGCIYAFRMRPDGTPAKIRCLGIPEFHDSGIAAVEQLGWGPVAFDRDETALTVYPAPTETDLPVCFRIRLA